MADLSKERVGILSSAQTLNSAVWAKNFRHVLLPYATNPAGQGRLGGSRDGGNYSDHVLKVGETFPSCPSQTVQSLTGYLYNAFQESRGSVKVTAG